MVTGVDAGLVAKFWPLAWKLTVPVYALGLWASTTVSNLWGEPVGERTGEGVP